MKRTRRVVSHERTLPRRRWKRPQEPSATPSFALLRVVVETAGCLAAENLYGIDRPRETHIVYDKQALIALVREKALEFGDFTLASGKKASFYLDCRKVTLDSAGANLIAEGILELLGDALPDAVGGMAIGADPITAAVITVAGQRARR